MKSIAEKADDKFHTSKPVGVDQTPGLCGPAVLKSILHFYGINEELKDIAKTIGANEEDGIEAPELLEGAKKYNLKGEIKDNSSFSEIRKLLGDEKQVVVEWFKDDDSHYCVVTDINNTEIELMDPESGDYKFITQKEFEPIWFTFPFPKHPEKRVDKRIIVLWKEDKFDDKRMDHFHKHKRISDPIYQKIVLEDVGQLYGYRVLLVDGEVIRDAIDVDFVMGGNPGRYEYVPPRELWIESHYADAELIPIAIHECVECEYMIRDGDSYDKAHEKATKHELQIRNDNIEINSLDEAEKYISGVFGRKTSAAKMQAILRYAELFQLATVQ